MIKTIEWKNNQIVLIDQTRLPEEEVYLKISDYQALCDAIKQLKVRGAPAIGIAGAFGVCLGANQSDTDSYHQFKNSLLQVIDELAATRPTAVNLFWALDRMRKILETSPTNTQDLKKKLLEEAFRILDEDKFICRKIGENGARLIRDGDTILTHCNAGALATADFGTALGVIYTAKEQGKNIKVFADETRPLLQGARLTTWELQKAGIDVTLICDNMAAFVMQKGWVDCILVGADRIAANGDTANKIGTYNLAVLAKYHHIPFYVAAPRSTIDMNLKSGSEIPIEERAPEEVSCGFGKQTAPAGVNIYNPAFDVTPYELINGIVTERRIIYPPFELKL